MRVNDPNAANQGVPAFQVDNRQWAAEKEPLNLIRCRVFEVLPLRFRFHAFGDGLQAQALCHRGDGVDQRCIAAIFDAMSRTNTRSIFKVSIGKCRR